MPLSLEGAVGAIRQGSSTVVHVTDKVGEAGASAIAGALRESPNNSKLTTLYLYGNEIGAAGACAIAEALREGRTCSLRSLNLQANQVGDAGAHALADALRYGANCSLTSLYLTENQIGDDGARALADALREGNCKLSSLDLQLNQIGEAGACALADALREGNSTLSKLNLTQNRIGGPGGVSLAQALRKGSNSTLSSLNLRANGVDFRACHAFMDAIREGTIPSLTSLDLSHNDEFKKSDLKVMAKALRAGNSSLASLSVFGVSPHVTSALQWNKRRLQKVAEEEERNRGSFRCLMFCWEQCQISVASSPRIVFLGDLPPEVFSIVLKFLVPHWVRRFKLEVRISSLSMATFQVEL